MGLLTLFVSFNPSDTGTRGLGENRIFGTLQQKCCNCSRGVKSTAVTEVEVG